MGQQILFFEKSKCDYANEAASVTASQGNTYVYRVRDRRNDSGWRTTGSVDADNTYIEADLADVYNVNNIILINNNFKSYIIQYRNPINGLWTDFSPAINETNNTKTTIRHEFTGVTPRIFRITIYGTMTPNDDKQLTQLIITDKIGKLTAWPVIKSPKHDNIHALNIMSSGKYYVQKNVTSFMCELESKSWLESNDIAIIEKLFNSIEGFLVWLCGGDETQFSNLIQGYRLQDLYLMNTKKEYQPVFFKGIYNTGIKTSLPLVEVTF